MFDFIAGPLGSILYFIYNTVAFKNYGFAIIIFTVLVKLLLLPLTVKQLKASAKMQELQPKLMELQKKYKNDKERLGQETMNFYKENNYNPASGCLPALVQFPIIICLLWVVTQPLKFMLGMHPTKIITPLAKKVAELSVGSAHPVSEKASYVQIDIMKFLSDNINNSNVINSVKDFIKPEQIFSMKFLGLNLGDVPSLDVSKIFGSNAIYYIGLLIIPTLAVVTTYFSTKISMAATTANNNSPNMPNMKYMIYFAPLMTLLFAFNLPLGLPLYWTVSYVFQILQQLYINKFILAKIYVKKVEKGKLA
jgi:YidC/Oxa1 family membrane protein insertase